jgi:predicted DCC family thiol-disulfide oxidoreductase YuxK
MRDLLEQGGPVVAVILALSTLAWVLIGWEWLRLRQQSGGDWSWVDTALEALEQGDKPPPALLHRYRFNLIGRLLGAGLDRRSRPRRAFHTQVAPHLRSEAVALQRPLRLIAVLASVLPLLGLLGTVLGMVRTFEALMAGEGARDVEWVDITGREEELLRQGIDPDRALRELHVRDGEGHIHRELDAYRLLMGRVPRLKPLGWLIGLPVIRPLVSWIYRTMVDRRLRRTGRG